MASGELGQLGQLVEYMAKCLVDEPDQVQVLETINDQSTVIELKVAKVDLGKIIGKQGRTARSLRSLLAAASSKNDTRSILEIVE